MSLPSSFDAPAPEALAARMSAYDFEMLIASGVTGAVYKARQKSLDRDVAVKILPPERMADPKVRQAFESGARVLARLNHPNLISVYDCGEVDGMPYLVMEFVPGKSLQRSASGKKIDPAQAAELVIAISKGLAHAHDNGVIHRDLKLANILLNQKAEPKIGDFGLADLREAGGENGAYIAPEVLRQPEVADRRSDVYSVGIILYTLLAGAEPHAVSPLPSVVCSVDGELDRIFQRATNPNPGFRYPDCHEFAADLSAWLKQKLAGRAAAAAASGATPEAETPARAAAPLRAPAKRLEEDEIQEVRKGGFGGVLVNLILLGVLGGGGYFLWNKYNEGGFSSAPTSDVSKPAPGTSGDSGSSKSSGTSLIPRGGTPRADEPSPFGTPVPGTGGQTDTKTTETASGNEAPDQFTDKARELIAAAEKERTQALTTNVRNFASELDSGIRSLAKKEQAATQAEIDKLKGFVRDFRVPVTIPDGGPVKATPAMAKSLARAAEAQKQIDTTYATKVGRIRDFYIPKMRTAIEEAKGKGQSTGQLSQRLSATSDLAIWVTSLGGTLQPANPVIEEVNEYKGIFGPTNPFGTPVR
ncbi:serine/threonine-protein kinase [Luteolibacter sp. LG18]|uniref:serine/threonine-protein kinase n=1 Tax=Luteolibacter sp. LG18 TaxID=2819286 RepID=UPI002B2E43E1|nr:hypothetical protein llg_12400 [Luteolibacter sp. LG18]